MKLEIIETSEYVLAVSNEDISVGDYVATKERFLDGTVKKQEDFDNAKWQLSFAYMEDMVYIERARHGKNAANGLCGCEKVVAYLPKGKKELSLPLLPEIIEKSKTPKYFICETEVVSDEIDHIYTGNVRYGVKTKTIKGKTYLVGKYV